MRFLRNMMTYFWSFWARTSLGGGRPKVNALSRFTKNTYIGDDCHFNGFKVLGVGRVTIGKGFHSGSGCKVITDVHNYNGTALPYDNTYITKDVSIGDYVWLGQDVTVLGGVVIGEGVIVQAGSVVVCDIPALSIAGGHPATVFSMRDESHYFTIKSKEFT
ncbi:acyltransferase [Marinagarivorans algicola]|uniref:acyltransferase n=1 Tax=Marinagarivorans algicola TaxID=1513270 RepID=UPI0006B68BCE|nr:acyltransferase [Marinagarivorans algicola]